MSARAIAGLAALLLVTLAAGWWTAARIDHAANPPLPDPPAITVPEAPPEEAMLPPEAELPEPLPVAPPTPTTTTPPPSTAVRSRPSPPRATTRAAPTTTPAPEPAPDPEPVPEPEPEPEPTTRATTTRAAPNPRPRPQTTAPTPTLPRAVTTSSPPPETRRINAAEAFTGSDSAHRALVEARRRAVPDSPTDRAIRRQLKLWRRYLSPAATGVPAGRAATVSRALRASAWWYSRWQHPAGNVLLRDQDGVILTHRAGQGFATNPVATTGRWRDLNDDLSVEQMAEVMLPMGIERDVGGVRMLVWEYYDIVGDPDAIRPGISGMAQARLGLVMANAYRATGDPRFADAAGRAIAAFRVPVDDGGARSMVRMHGGQTPMPWYVERANPGANPWTGAALNGFMVTLLNLRGAAASMDAAAGGGEDATGVAARARDLADVGAVTLERHLPDHDTGTWSFYGMLSGGHPWRTYLADLNYHCYHVFLLGRLATVYPDRPFEATAARWQGYVDGAGLTCPRRAGQD